MTNTRKFAETELAMLVLNARAKGKELEIEPYIQGILEIAEKFGKSGHSGGSAHFVAINIASHIEKILLQKPLGPIYGTEWIDVSEDFLQNSRCAALFKKKKDEKGRAHYLEAIVFRMGLEYTFTGSVLDSTGMKSIGSSQYVKSFPFTPKTFHIDVEDVSGNIYIKDMSQLKEVFEYYDEMILQ